MIFLDTNIAILLRDLDPAMRTRVQSLTLEPVLSMITWIELVNGSVGADAPRQARLAKLLESVPVEMFTPADVRAYAGIVGVLGHDRRRTLDWLIASQALARDAVLATRNPRDFRMIDGLSLEEW